MGEDVTDGVSDGDTDGVGDGVSEGVGDGEGDKDVKNTISVELSGRLYSRMSPIAPEYALELSLAEPKTILSSEPSGVAPEYESTCTPSMNKRAVFVSNVNVTECHSPATITPGADVNSKFCTPATVLVTITAPVALTRTDNPVVATAASWRNRWVPETTASINVASELLSGLIHRESVAFVLIGVVLETI